MGSGTAAADPRNRIAFDDCYFVYSPEEDPITLCDVFVADADGPGRFLVAAGGIRPVSGITPVTDVADPDGGPSGTNDGGPSWSPDGARIAFDCPTRTAGNLDVCTIQPDGLGRVRLTKPAKFDGGPAFSPDGSRIVFTTGRYGSFWAIAAMNADGSGVSRVGNGTGYWPDWSYDGSRIAFAEYFVGVCDPNAPRCYDTIHVVNADGTADRVLQGGSNPSWRDSAQPMGPIASFTHVCVALHCDLDGSSSWDLDGTITSYEWNFGDGATGSGPTAAHTYAAIGPYVVTLTVTDDNGLVGTASRSVLSPPATQGSFEQSTPAER